MTPKEKATLIVHQIYSALFHTNAEFAHVKQCALIAVDEVLEELDHLPFDNQSFGTSKMKYWQQVKQEIEKL